MSFRVILQKASVAAAPLLAEPGHRHDPDVNLNVGLQMHVLFNLNVHVCDNLLQLGISALITRYLAPQAPQRSLLLLLIS